SAAAAAGLRPGDVILGANGQAITSFTALQTLVSAAPEQQLTLQVERDGALVELSATPQRNGNRGMLGVSGPLVLESERVIERFGPLTALGAGAANTWDIIAKTGAYIGAIFAGRESGDQIAGPLGIINVSGQVATSALSSGGGDDGGIAARIGLLALSLLSLAAVLSVAVGIVNLLPIPILDGGHLLFYGIEAVRGGKPLPASAQEWAYRAGFAVMASLFLFATWNDITRLLPGAQ
nr:site-2 protease family protein [Terricaulis sp.]